MAAGTTYGGLYQDAVRFSIFSVRKKHTQKKGFRGQGSEKNRKVIEKDRDTPGQDDPAGSDIGYQLNEKAPEPK